VFSCPKGSQTNFVVHVRNCDLSKSTKEYSLDRCESGCNYSLPEEANLGETPYPEGVHAATKSCKLTMDGLKHLLSVDYNWEDMSYYSMLGSVNVEEGCTVGR
jgi:hypothetical protein